MGLLIPISDDAFVAVDCWNPRNPPGSTVAAYFLTHAHSDHMAGLHDGWGYPRNRNNASFPSSSTTTARPPQQPPATFFCSPETKAVLEAMGHRRLARRAQLISPGDRVVVTRSEAGGGVDGARDENAAKKKRKKHLVDLCLPPPALPKEINVRGLGVALEVPFPVEEEDDDIEIDPFADKKQVYVCREEHGKKDEEEEEEEEEGEEEVEVATIDALDAQHCLVGD